MEEVSEADINKEQAKVEKIVEELEFKKMLSGEEDQLSAALQINPGAGWYREPGLGRNADAHVHHVGRKRTATPSSR